MHSHVSTIFVVKMESCLIVVARVIDHLRELRTKEVTANVPRMLDFRQARCNQFYIQPISHTVCACFCNGQSQEVGVGWIFAFLDSNGNVSLLFPQDLCHQSKVRPIFLRSVVDFLHRIFEGSWARNVIVKKFEGLGS